MGEEEGMGMDIVPVIILRRVHLLWKIRWIRTGICGKCMAEGVWDSDKGGFGHLSE